MRSSGAYRRPILSILTAACLAPWVVQEGGIVAGETCVRVSNPNAQPGQEVKAIDVGPLHISAGMDAGGTTVPMVYADCNNDGGTDLLITSSGPQASRPARIALSGSCVNGAVEVAVTVATDNAVLDARDASGKLVDSVQAAPKFGEQKLVLAHAGGIDTVDIVAAQTCLVEICWRCAEEPANRLAFQMPNLAACGQAGLSLATIDAAEPVVGLQAGLRWDPAVLDVLEIRPGAGVPAGDIETFSVERGPAASGLQAGEAAVMLFLRPGAALPPGNGIQVLAIEVRTTGAAANVSPTLCLDDGQGKPALASRIVVLRGGDPAAVAFPPACGAVALLADGSPPSLACPPPLVVDGSADGAVVSWQVGVEDSCRVKVTCRPPSGSFFPVGTTTVVCLASDAAGNAAQCSFPVTVRAAPGGFRRGDVTGEGGLDISDPIAALGYLFLGNQDAGCLKAADANDDGKVDISDPASLLSHLFMGGPAPPPPFGACGPDPTPDGLACQPPAGCREANDASLLTDRLLERLARGEFRELRLTEELQEHIAYELSPAGDLDFVNMTSWSGGIAVAPQLLAQLGRRVEMKRFEEGQEAKDAWYDLGGARLSKPLLNDRNEHVGLFTLGGAVSLLALDFDADGVADVLDIVEPAGGEMLLVGRPAGMAFLESAVRLLSGRRAGTGRTTLIRGSAGSSEPFGPVTGLREVIGTREGDWPGGLGSEPLFAALLWLLERRPLAGNLPPDPLLAAGLPHLPRVLPGPYLDSQLVVEFSDHPVIEVFAVDSAPPCTVTASENPLIFWRVSPSLGGSPITSVRLWALERHKVVRWDPRHVIRSRYSIDLLHESAGAPDGSQVRDSYRDFREGRLDVIQYALIAENAAGRRTTAILPYSYIGPVEFPFPTEITEQVAWREWAEEEGCWKLWWKYKLPFVRPQNVGRLFYQIRFAGDSDFRPYEEVPFLHHDPGQPVPYSLVFLSPLCEDPPEPPWHGNVRGIRIRAESVDDCSTAVEREVTVHLIERLPDPDPEREPEPERPAELPDLVSVLSEFVSFLDFSIRPVIANIGEATAPSGVQVVVAGGASRYAFRIPDAIDPCTQYVSPLWYTFAVPFTISVNTGPDRVPDANSFNDGMSCRFSPTRLVWECTCWNCGGAPLFPCRR